MSFFFTQKTAYEMRISDWSSDVCSSDLRADQQAIVETGVEQLHRARGRRAWARFEFDPRDETAGTHVDDMARALQAVRGVRSEERRVGKECISTCRARWSPEPSQNKI